MALRNRIKAINATKPVATNMTMKCEQLSYFCAWNAHATACKIAETICPITCGCHNPCGGSFAHNGEAAMTSCPFSCHSRILAEDLPTAVEMEEWLAMDCRPGAVGRHFQDLKADVFVPGASALSFNASAGSALRLLNEPFWKDWY